MPKDVVRVGASFTYELKTTEDMGAHRFQESSPPVFATPFLVGAVEAAAARLMEPDLEDGEMSVGALVELRHTRPTPLGWTVRTTAHLEEKQGKKYVFRVECHDEAEPIGEARHVRYVIEAGPFLAAVREKASRKEGSG
ncbi:thioesterase family protein [Deferrisoma sp.]